MILSPHAIVGAAIANIIPNEPVLGFGLAFLSHYVLDVFPHVDYKINNFLEKETKTVKSIFENFGAALHFLFIALDFIVAIFLCILFFVRDEKSAIITIIGLAGGVMPDFFQFLYFKYKKQPWAFMQKVHDKFHHEVIEDESKKPLGIMFQFLLPMLVLVFYFIIKI